MAYTPEDGATAPTYGTASQDAFTADAMKATDEARQGNLDATRAEQAKLGSDPVSRPVYMGYAEVLANYEARSDTEPLADRRARDHGEAFTDADFVRAADYTGDATAAETSRT